jgi:hypothetical protein
LKPSEQNFYREGAKKGKGKAEGIKKVILQQKLNRSPNLRLPCLCLSSRLRGKKSAAGLGDFIEACQTLSSLTKEFPTGGAQVPRRWWGA